MAPLKVIIIGCGLAGGLLGNGLLQHDVDFKVYEADQRNNDREGYQIRLGSPALVGFKACLTPEQQTTLYKMFGRSGGMVSSAPVLYDTNLVKLLDLTKFPAYTKSAPISRRVLRDFFQKPLDEANRIVFGKSFERYEIVDQAGCLAPKVKVIFADGSTDWCDLLISAEGSVSKINKQVGLDNILQLRSKWGFLAKGALPPSKLMSLTPEVRAAPMTIIKGGMVLFYSAYLPEGLKKSQTPPAKADDMEYDDEIASLFWGLSIPTEMCPDDPRKLDDKIEFCLDKIKNWDPRIHEMLRAIDNKDIYVFQARASKPPAKNWRNEVKQHDRPSLGSDQVWLMGDAIHAMLPSRGMGGNQSMNDTADALGQILDLAHKSQQRSLKKDDFAQAVKTYETAMIPRAFKWVAISGGTESKLRDPTSFGGRIMLFLVAGLLNLASVVTTVRSFFGWKVEDDAPELPN